MTVDPPFDCLMGGQGGRFAAAWALKGVRSAAVWRGGVSHLRSTGVRSERAYKVFSHLWYAEREHALREGGLGLWRLCHDDLCCLSFLLPGSVSLLFALVLLAYDNPI